MKEGKFSDEPPTNLPTLERKRERPCKKHHAVCIDSRWGLMMIVLIEKFFVNPSTPQKMENSRKLKGKRVIKTWMKIGFFLLCESLFHLWKKSFTSFRTSDFAQSDFSTFVALAFPIPSLTRILSSFGGERFYWHKRVRAIWKKLKITRKFKRLKEMARKTREAGNFPRIL